MRDGEEVKNQMKQPAACCDHVRSVKKMVEEGRDCSDVLTQLAAIHQAVENTTKAFLKEHIEHCVTEAIKEGKQDEALQELEVAIDRFMR